ncbi:MAG: HU family DNA-binding protein [Clostridia bacterium]|nr:HU family DNA-binding protein [Clostridia bacterium]MBR7136236.1 HU family DNA-binding protein [Clostridia bacterium]
MNKSEFIRKLADKQGVTIKEADENFVAFVETLTECLKEGEYVHVSGFATFEVKGKDAREGVNPKTKERIIIPSCKAPTVKFSKAYKELFN